VRQSSNRERIPDLLHVVNSKIVRVEILVKNRVTGHFSVTGLVYCVDTTITSARLFVCGTRGTR